MAKALGVVVAVCTAGMGSAAVAQVPPGQDVQASASAGDQANSTASNQMAASSGEIVVTALKQDETLSRAPVTVSVVDSEALASANIVHANELGKIVPGLSQAPGLGGIPATTIRGLGSNASTFSLEPSVGLFQDGIFLSHFRDWVTPLFDVAQIEVIKGTQAAILGKNTSVGAISIVNRRPGPDFGYDLVANYSFETEGKKLSGGVDVPLSDELQARVAFIASDEEGYYRNRFLNRDEQSIRDLGGRISLEWEPSATTNILLMYQHGDRRARGQVLEPLTDPAGAIAARATALGQTGFEVIPNGISYSGNTIGGLGAARSAASFEDLKYDRMNLIAEFDLGGVNLTSQSTYNGFTSTRSDDQDFTGAPLLLLDDFEKNRQFTQEVRLALQEGGRIEGLIGGYYYYNNWDLQRAVIGSSGGIGFPLTGRYDNTVGIVTNAISAFASAKFNVTDTLALLASGRFTHEEKEASFVRTGSGPVGASQPPIAPTTLPKSSENNLDGSFGVQFQATPQLMLYGTWSKGSKSGGYQDVPTTAATAYYGGETAYTIEAGGKLNLGPRGSVAVAAFQTRVKNFQASYVALVGGIPQSLIGNANLRSRGVEASASFEVADGFSISGNILHAPAIFTDNFPLTPPFLATDRSRSPRSPSWTGRVALDVDRPVSDNLKVVGGASLFFASATTLHPPDSQPLAPTIEAHELVDLKLGVGSTNNSWELALLGTNVFNDWHVVFTTRIPGGAGAYYGSINRPRVIALQLTLKR